MKDRIDVNQSTELGEVKSLLQKLRERIDKLVEETQQTTTHQGKSSRYARGTRHRGQGRGDIPQRLHRSHRRGQSSYTPRRPTARPTFRPAGVRCYSCGMGILPEIAIETGKCLYEGTGYGHR